MSIPLYMPKEEVLSRLNAQLPAAEKQDKAAKEKHLKDEAVALKLFKERLREALKWDYQTMKRHKFEIELPWKARPDCPVPRADKLKRLIKEIEITSTRRFKLSNNGAYSHIHAEIIRDLPAEKSIC
jgi:hypothetical protein